VFSGAKKCDNCSAICDKAIKHDGRWFYECKNFTGDLEQYNNISIVWKYGNWQVLAQSAKGYIEIHPTSSVGEHDDNGKFDYQVTSSSSVCIDPDASALDVPGWQGMFPEALFQGSLECLDGQDWVFRCDKVLLLPCGQFKLAHLNFIKRSL